MNLFYIFSLIFTQQIVATYLVYTNPSVRIQEDSYEQPHQTLDLQKIMLADRKFLDK